MPEEPPRLTWDELFEPTPGSWGYRGDPFAWFMLRARLALGGLPEGPEHDRAVLRDAFRDVVGIDLDDRLLPEALYVRAFAFGGMSSGTVALHHWRDHLLPLLCSVRLTCVRVHRRQCAASRGGAVSSRRSWHWLRPSIGWRIWRRRVTGTACCGCSSRTLC